MTTSALLPLPIFRAFDAAGLPLAGGLLYSYQANSTTPQNTYSSTDLSVPNTNPVVLDSTGSATVRLDPTLTYKFVLKDTTGTTTFWTEDYYNSNYLTQAAVAALLYPQTAAESAASVTPTNYVYPPGNVRRYGAVGDGSTDNTTALQNALNVAQYSGSMYFPSASLGSQTVYTTGPLTVYENTCVSSDPSVIIEMNTNSANTNIFNATSTFGTATTLTANGVAGTASVTVTSAAGLSIGQLVEIYDSTYAALAGSTGQNLELNEITNIVSTTITLKNNLLSNYATASTASLKPATVAARKIRFEGLTLRVPTSKDGGGIICTDAYDCEIINCRCIGPKSQAGFTFWRSGYCRARGVTVQDGQSQSTPGYGYGFSMGSSAHNCVVSDSVFRDVRENAMSDGVRFCRFDNCAAISCYDNGFNTHALGASDCQFNDCLVLGSYSKGFYVGGSSGNQAYDKRITLNNPVAINCGYRGIWIDGAVSYETQDIIVNNPRVFNCAWNSALGASDYPVYIYHSVRPRVVGGMSDANGSSNVRGSIHAELCTDAVITKFAARGATSGWGIIHTNCTGIAIEDNAITNCGSGEAVHAGGTPSAGRVLIRRNTVDNDTSITLTAGYVIEHNEYATKRQQNKGVTGAIASGATVTHGLVTTPSVVILTPQDGTPTAVFPSAIGGTTFAITYTGGGTHAFAWQAFT